MKCPNCEKEVSPEFNVCPWCGYRPKKCSKPEHQNVWLPEEARFCPRCGESLPGGSNEEIRDPKRGNDDSMKETLDFNVDGVRFTMIRVDGGSFMMGAAENDSEADGDEKPRHRVSLSGYYIGETQVTQALWEAVMGNNPSYFKGDNKPVEQVSWHDCWEFIERLNQKTGRRFRLPTEAEWEFAARGGNKSKCFKYAGSNHLEEVAWCKMNSNDRTHYVKQKKPNELGLYDMTGNVWEWCQDWYGSYNSGTQNDPTGPTSGSDRVGRGGSWCDDAGDCRLSCRSYGTPDFAGNYLGFRLVLSE